MVRRYRSRKKLTTRKRRVYRRIPRAPRTGMNVLSLQRTFWVENWSPNTATTNGFWRLYAPTWNQLPDVSQFQAVFEQYRINKIKITFRPRYDSFAGNDTTDTTLPGVTNQAGNMCHVIVDPATLTSPSGTYTSANLNTYLENGKVKTYMGNRPINITYTPKVVMLTGTASSGVFTKAQWLQTSAAAGAAVPHYGVHIFMQDVNLTGNFGQSFDVFYTFDFQMKGMK